jgi:hypothetical protein
VNIERRWSSGWLCHVEFWWYANVLEEHTASVFRAEVKSVRKWTVYMQLGGSSSQGVWPVGAIG